MRDVDGLDVEGDDGDSSCFAVDVDLIWGGRLEEFFFIFCLLFLSLGQILELHA